MEIIFVGGFFFNEMDREIRENSKKTIQNAANNFQWAVIKGIEENMEKSVSLLTAPFIGYFPFYYRELLIKGRKFHNRENKVNHSVGFVNLPLLKAIFKYKNLLNALQNWRDRVEKNPVIILYSLNLPYLKAVSQFKCENPQVKVYCIITDLPEFPADTSFLHRLYIDKYEKHRIYKYLSYLDGFIVLSDYMVERLKITNKPWVRVEGIFDDSRSEEPAPAKETYKTVLYTGTLDKRYGIDRLLLAFEKIPHPNFRLWICGGGNGEELVKQAAAKDSRIKFWGLLERSAVLNLQQRATLLVNPRNTQGEYNKFSFPSKTMEYLASGTPALLYKLSGMPQEYFNYCFTVSDNSIKSLSSAIINSCNRSPEFLEQMGISAKNYILKEKTSKVQASKILNMILENRISQNK